MQSVLAQVPPANETGAQRFPWEAVTAVSTAILAVVTAGLLLGVVLAYRQYKEGRLGQQVTLLQDQQDKYRTPRIHRARKLLDDPDSALRTKLAAAQHDGNLSIEDLDPDELAQMKDLLSFFEFLSALVKFKALDVSQVKAVFPDAPRKYWDITEPYVQQRRKEGRGDGYLASYEDLIKLYFGTSNPALKGPPTATAQERLAP
jgi:hypothetical protein